MNYRCFQLQGALLEYPGNSVTFGPQSRGW
jgi:hypothetical protein